MSLNDPSFFRKGGLLVNPEQRIYLEMGRDPVTGDWYVDQKHDDGRHLRSVLSADKAFNLGKGILVAMARFQPGKIGEIRSLLAALTPHV